MRLEKKGVLIQKRSLMGFPFFTSKTTFWELLIVLSYFLFSNCLFWKDLFIHVEKWNRGAWGRMVLL